MSDLGQKPPRRWLAGAAAIPPKATFPAPLHGLYYYDVRACHLQADLEEIVALYRLTLDQPSVK